MADVLSTNLTPYVAAATAAASLANLALVVPLSSQPAATRGYQPNPGATSSSSSDFGFDFLSDLALPPALLFHYEGENVGLFESDITDHFVEDNTTIVDQIGLRPEIVTVSGYIGELTDILPLPLQILQTIANNLLLLDPYTPGLGPTAQEKLNQAVVLYESARSIANSSIAAWSSLSTALSEAITGNVGQEVVGGSGVFTVGDEAVQNQQQIMFQQFYGYWIQRNLFNIQTPWAIFTNMAIKQLRAIQDADTRMITNFEITFKKIRTASTKIDTVSGISQGRTAMQGAPATANGTTSGVPGASLGSNIGDE